MLEAERKLGLKLSWARAWAENLGIFRFAGPRNCRWWKTHIKVEILWMAAKSCTSW